MIPSFYEGPVIVDNITVAHNSFYVPSSVTTKDVKDFIWHANGTGLVVVKNQIIRH